MCIRDRYGPALEAVAGRRSTPFRRRPRPSSGCCPRCQTRRRRRAFHLLLLRPIPRAQQEALPPSAGRGAATAMGRRPRDLRSDSAIEGSTRASHARPAARRRPPAGSGPRLPAPAATRVLFPISTDWTLDQRGGAREFETVFETEEY